MTAKGIFDGVRIVELAQYVFVPGGSVLLADQGAEVIHVEPPMTGDPYRTLKVGDGREIGSVNLAMEQNNRNKKSIALDLKTEDGREALLKLIETADVFLSSIRPQALRKLRLDVDDLRARNPKIIYARGNGLGFRGEEAHKPGFDASAFWARGGACYAFTRPGQQPTSPRPAFGDHSGGMAVAFGIASALFKRAMTGEPSVVETSLLSTAVWMLSSDITYSQMPHYSLHGAVTRVALKYAYTTRDGRIIQFMLLDPRPHWGPLCRLLGLEHLVDDPRFAGEEERIANSDQLIPIIQDRIGAEEFAHWKPLLDGFDGSWEVIQTIDDLSTDPQVIANEMIFSMDVGGVPVRMVSGPTAFDGAARPAEARPAPALGAHSEALLTEIGYSADAIADLRARGIAQ
ncbi:CoA transferase [Sphingobium sufflavum]|uniref:CaiB/BaiF CoA transferase family protein n=1 Tax=Sphingobium sufflavum TaxID=1129547 RepID=UPI001F29411A|nr:CaiB/BaiF CoA-transferase family protein [Sphingobium sufflavum]MCE7795440.1 CoA transferase [Sphingobium sufflavum]